MTVSLTAGRLDRARLALAADWLAVGVALSLPWSTSATAILIAVWLVALVPTLDVAILRREGATAAGGLPVLLWMLAAVGMLWAHVDWTERFVGLGGFHRLLVIPILLAQFRRSPNGARVLNGFLISATALLILSWMLALFPGLPWPTKGYGIPVKDYMFQSAIFLVCVFGLLGRAFDVLRAGKWLTASWLGGLAALFFANIVFVATSRTVLAVAVVLVILLGWRQFGARGALTAVLVGAVLGAGAWSGSPYLRARVMNLIEETRAYDSRNEQTSAGLRLEFWKKSLGFVQTAPLFGHGTGSIPDQFRRSARGESGATAVVSVNPHNQIFAVAIQLGAFGTVILAAMWLAHLALFRGGDPAAWIGLVVVVQNIVSSLANSHLFDFAHGWLYVFGVGVIGGMVLRREPGTPR